MQAHTYLISDTMLFSQVSLSSHQKHLIQQIYTRNSYHFGSEIQRIEVQAYDQSYRKDHHEMLSFLMWRAQSKFCSTSHLQLLIRLLAGFSRSDASEEHLLHTQASPLLLRLGIAI